MAPEFGDLPTRIRAWAGQVHRVWTFERVSERIKEDSFEVEVRSVLGRSSATRGAELMTTALLVCEIVGVDALQSLREANAARDREAGASRGVEDLLEALRTVAGRAGPGLSPSEFVVVRQTEVRAEMDRARKERRMFPLKDGEFSRLRKDALIRDDWRIKIHGVDHWKVPRTFLATYTGGDPPESPEPPAPQVDRVSGVARVDPVGAVGGAAGSQRTDGKASQPAATDFGFDSRGRGRDAWGDQGLRPHGRPGRSRRPFRNRPERRVIPESRGGVVRRGRPMRIPRDSDGG